MPKSKYARALFEVIDSSKDQESGGKLTPPTWWKSTRAAAVDGSAGESEPAREALAREPLAQPAADPAARPAMPSVVAPRGEHLRVAPGLDDAGDESSRIPPHEPGGLPPVFQLRAGRVELSLNPVSACVVGGTLLLALLASFELGRGLAPVAGATLSADAGGETGDPLAEAMKQAPNPDVLKRPPGLSANRLPTRAVDRPPPEANRSAKAAVAPPTERAGRGSGLNHIRLESFRAEHLDDAKHAQAWLMKEHGLATVLKQSGDWWLLVSQVGFDYNKPGEKSKAREYLANVPSLGKQYKEAFKGKRVIRYDFRSPLIEKQ